MYITSCFSSTFVDAYNTWSSCHRHRRCRSQASWESADSELSVMLAVISLAQCFSERIQTLTTLDLFNNSIGANGAGDLAEALRVNRVRWRLLCGLHTSSHEYPQTLTKWLDLYSNGIGGEGAGHLGEALKVNQVRYWLSCALHSRFHACWYRHSQHWSSDWTTLVLKEHVTWAKRWKWTRSETECRCWMHLCTPLRLPTLTTLLLK